jgi:hypothetical protein
MPLQLPPPRWKNNTFFQLYQLLSSFKVMTIYVSGIWRCRIHMYPVSCRSLFSAVFACLCCVVLESRGQMGSSGDGLSLVQMEDKENEGARIESSRLLGENGDASLTRRQRCHVYKTCKPQLILDKILELRNLIWE